MKNLKNFIERLKKININITLISNYPWIYLDTINGVPVKEKQYSKYKYTLGFMSMREKDVFKFENIQHTFKLIRKYISNTNSI